MRLVVKFGGTSLATGERIERAAASIADVISNGHEVVVVASAMGDQTDQLLDTISFDASQGDKAEILSMGERISIRMLKAALATKGVDATFIEPGDTYWPIKTNSHGDIDTDTTADQVATLENLIGDTVPVVAGFVGESEDGDVTTLGRGGSDTTAVLLGRYLNADKVVIVTDVEGIMTGDPRVVEGAQYIDEITVDELRSLSFRGAEVIASNALSYKDEDLEIRVIHYQHNDLLSGGTLIEGEFSNLIDMRERPLACLTVAGRAIRNQEGILSRLSSALSASDINIDAVASGMDSLTFYVDEDIAERAENILHQEVIDDNALSSVTVTDNVAVIRVLGGELPTKPGVIHELTAPLADAHINIHDLITSATSVAVFVSWEDREATLEKIQRKVEEISPTDPG
ncbi:MAG: aspartate kinase [Halobacteriaceae archaeon]